MRSARHEATYVGLLQVLQARKAAQEYVYAYSRLAADLVDLVSKPFFTWLLSAPAGRSSLPGCMRMLTVLRVAAAYAFVNLQAMLPHPAVSLV